MSRAHDRALRLLERRARERGLAPSTVVSYLSVGRSFLARLARPLRRADRGDVRRWLASRTADGVAATTLARNLSVLRSVCALLLETRLLARDPTAGLALPWGRSRPPLVLSRLTVEKLLAAALAPPVRSSARPEVARALRLRDRACLELLYGLGLRASELRLRVGDLNLPERTVLVRRAKRGGQAFLPLPAAAVPHLAAYLRQGRPALVRPEVEHGGALFLSQYGRPLDNDLVTTLVTRAAQAAGVRAHPHALRRALATHLVADGVPIPCVQELLGHVKLTTTAVYVAVDRQELRRAVEVLDRVLGR